MLLNVMRSELLIVGIIFINIYSTLSQSECKHVLDDGVIPLVVGSGANLTTCEEGLKYLRQVLGDDNLYITVVVGPARQGKSFFLNAVSGHHVKHGGGFSVGHTPIGHTKGFWISPKHNESTISTIDGDVVSLFLDTEGFGAIGNLEAYDPKLCAIVSIFASNLFYNVMRSISMDDLKFISSIAVLDKYFQKSHNTTFSTPPLAWVLQSFELSLDDFTPPNALGYLKYVLAKKTSDEKMDDGDRRQMATYNELLDSILDKFDHQNSISNGTDRTVPPIIILDRPSQIKMSQLPSLSFEEYSPDYQAQIVALRDQIKRGARRKYLSPGIPLTGKTFADNIEILTQSMNQLAEVGDAYVRSVAKQAAMVVFYEYNSTVRSLPSPSWSQAHYNIEMSRIRVTSLNKFQESCVGKIDDVVNAEVHVQLQKDMSSEERVLSEQNMNAEFSRCQELSHDLLTVLQATDISECTELSVHSSLHSAYVEHECVDNKSDAQSDDGNADILLSIENDVIMLRNCRDRLLNEYRLLCGVAWCDVLSPSRQTCTSILNKTWISFERQLSEGYDARMKSLATHGFASLNLAVFVSYPALRLLACLGLKNEFLTTFVLFLVFSMAFLSMLNSALWFRMVVCSESTKHIGGFSDKCNYWAEELPKVIGIGFNAYVLPFLFYCRLLIVGVWNHGSGVYTYIYVMIRAVVVLAAHHLLLSHERDAFVEATHNIISFATFLLLGGCIIAVYFTVKGIAVAIVRIVTGRRQSEVMHTSSPSTSTSTSPLISESSPCSTSPSNTTPPGDTISPLSTTPPGNAITPSSTTPTGNAISPSSTTPTGNAITPLSTSSTKETCLHSNE